MSYLLAYLNFEYDTLQFESLKSASFLSDMYHVRQIWKMQAHHRSFKI